MRPNGFEELKARYGLPWVSQEEKERFERHWMCLWSFRDFQLRTGVTWPHNSIPFDRIYCNRDILPVLDKTFVYLIKLNLIGEIHSFDGCWNVRMKRRNLNEPSVHSFGIALDFNANLMPFGSKECLWSDKFLQAMDACDWILGAEFPIKDFQHFQWCSGY